MQEDLDFYLTAGKIAASALHYAREIISEGMPVLELCEKIESFILKQGGSLAFPCNVSINEVAAHDTAETEDEIIVPKRAIVKIDVGVHVKGCIADTATTVCFNNEYLKLVEATKKALKNALDNFKAGNKTNKIGKIIDQTAKLYGFNTIKNLAGHMIKKNLLHAGKSIPNYDDGYEETIEVGEVYAVEPFLTNGAGYVYDSDQIKIFSLKRPTKYKDKEIESLFNKIWKERFNLPFCLRWYSKIIDLNKLRKAINELMLRGEIVGYNVLVENNKGMVAQEEHTVIVDEKDIIVTTLLE